MQNLVGPRNSQANPDLGALSVEPIWEEGGEDFEGGDGGVEEPGEAS